MELEERKKYALEVITKMIQLCRNTSYDEFNLKLASKSDLELLDYEFENKKLGLAIIDPTLTVQDINNARNNRIDSQGRVGISILSIIATLTDILVDDRMGFVIANFDEEYPGYKKNEIIRAFWFSDYVKKTTEI